MALLSKILDPIFGSDTSEQDQATKDALAQARAEYNIPLPETSIANPEALRNLGGYDANNAADYNLADPRLASLTNQGPSSYNDIQTDPRLRSNQQDALSALNELAASGGHNAQDQANLARNHSQAVQDDKSRRDAIMQNMGARGMGGSGNDLLAQLQSSQAATDRESQYGLDVSGQAQDRALQAMLQSGQLSGQMQNQDFNQEAQKAAARDSISQFNATNSNANSLANAQFANQNAMNRASGQLSVNQGNQAAQNSANQFNASNSQRVSDSNTANRNTAQSLRDALPQQQFNNLTTLASGKANADAGLANQAQNEANRITQKDANYLGAAVQGGTAIATSGGSTAKKKQEGY